jgi:hypothetical protein
VEVDMAFYHSIIIDQIPLVSVQPSWAEDPNNDIVIYDQIRESRVAATMFEYPVDDFKSIIPYSSIRVIGGP